MRIAPLRRGHELGNAMKATDAIGSQPAGRSSPATGAQRGDPAQTPERQNGGNGNPHKREPLPPLFLDLSCW